MRLTILQLFYLNLLREIEREASEEYERQGFSKKYKELWEEFDTHPETIKAHRDIMLAGAPGDMDPEVIGVVDALNSAGYTTFGSCAGHRGKRGFIALMDVSKSSKSEIVGILRDYGFKEIKFGSINNTRGWAGTNSINISFSGVG